MENREIKFRAWDEEEKEMIEWSDIFFSDMSKVTDYSDNFSYIEMPLMQYTGLKDKNGKEIYESDIHKTEPMDIDGKMQSSYLPIVFDNGAFWIDESFDKDGTYLTLLCEYDEPLNIVGNIHENKDLI